MTAEVLTNISRRTWLKNLVAAGATVLAAFDGLAAGAVTLEPQSKEALQGGKHLGNVDFLHEPRIDMGALSGSGLDGRLYTDLSSLSLDQAVVANAQFYVRTRASELLGSAESWQIRLGGSEAKRAELSIPELQIRTRPMGRHLMECSGNGRDAHFGMLSVADWAGVRVAEILDGMQGSRSSSHVLISGFDHYPEPSATSTEGASWIFSADQLRSSGAFLALQMNGEALGKDHGAPARLIVPGWYGCTCIKWVNEISFVAEDAPATAQMREFAFRTHQDGVPQLAKDFRPALIQQAALPIRVEKWLTGGNIKYRVIGIVWGGSQPVKTLEIRFNPEEDYVAVDHFAPASNETWSFWSHLWEPKAPGRYAIRLNVKEPPSKRLAAGFFVRSVEITEV